MLRFLFLLSLTLPLLADPTPTQLTNLPYKSGPQLTEYEQSRCQLDLYLPPNKTNFPTLLWFHGGGLQNGSKDNENVAPLGPSLAKEGLAVVIPNYRLSPQAKYPAYLEDAAAALAWTFANIEQHGGDPKRIYLGGHSAGGYLTLMLGMDPRWLNKHNLTRDQIAGLIPVAPQTMTHLTIREERLGTKSPFTIFADQDAPVQHANRKGLPPLLILWADNDMPARAEECAYLVALLKGAKNTSVTALEIPNRDHGTVAHYIANPNDPARQAILRFITP
ncbi:MAG: alpha/beta hydrolase [Verrucomicrobiota bacterium]